MSLGYVGLRCSAECYSLKLVSLYHITESLSIIACLAQNPNYVVGTVWDAGIGTDPKDIPRIFDEFYRVENAKAVERQGTRLGLSIVKRIVVEQPSPLRLSER